jgi:hypothetical protein
MNTDHHQIDLEEAIAAANDNGNNPPSPPAAAAGDEDAKKPKRSKTQTEYAYLLKQGGLTAYSLTQLANLPPEQWLIHGVLPSGEVILLYGPSRLGKSFLLIEMLMALATGRPFAGIQTERMAVLYIVTEGASGLPKRIKACQQHHRTTDDDPHIVVVAGQVDLYSEEGCKALVSFIRSLEKETGMNFGLIAIDTLAKAIGRAKENDNSDVTIVTLNAQKIGEFFAASMLLVHHTGKSEDAGPRGGSAFTGNVNASIKISKGQNGERIIELDKMKDEDDALRFCFTLEKVPLGTDDKGRPITSCVALVESVSARPAVAAQPLQPSPGAERLLALVTEAGFVGIDWADIADHPDFALQWAKRRATVVEWRAELLDAGKIRMQGSQRKKRLFAI